MVDGGVQGFEGYVLAVLPGVTPCYGCVFPQTGQGSDDALGAVTGVVGSMMATEAVKHIVGIPIDPWFYYVDLLGGRVTPINIAGEA